MSKIDILIKNGRVIDTVQGIDEVMDIGIRGNVMVDVKRPGVEAAKVVDAADCIVLPGLIDYHTHLFYGGSGFGIKPDYLLPYGVTSAVDAGSSGCDNYEAFRRAVIDSSTVRIKSFVNVFSGGMYDAKIPENFAPELFDAERLSGLKSKYYDDILGLKIRVSKEIVGYLGIEPLRETVKLAESIGDMSVCVHTTNPVATASEIASSLRENDVYCHCFHNTGESIMDADGKLYDAVVKARRRGVIFDESNGSKNYSNKFAAKAIEQGFLPDVISTDLSTVTFGLSNRCRSLPFVMSRYINMGLSLNTIVKCVTETPAKLMRMEGKTGTLREGAYGDVAIFKIVKHQVMFDDIHGDKIEGDRILIPQMTVCDGNIVFCQPWFCNM